MTEPDTLAFAARFVDAIQGGDVAAVRACYAPDARIWHNNDGLEQTVDENVRLLEWMMRKLPKRTYRIVRRVALPDGFLQQHVLETILPDGSAWAMPACVVVRMENGLIVRLDEYLDSAHFAALQTALRAASARP